MKDINIALLAIILVFGVLGMYFHFREVKKRGDAGGTFYDYLFADRPDRTGATILIYIGWMGTMWSTGAFDAVLVSAFIEALQNGYLYFPMANAIGLAFMSGYMIDSKVNKA